MCVKQHLIKAKNDINNPRAFTCLHARVKKAQFGCMLMTPRSGFMKLLLIDTPTCSLYYNQTREQRGLCNPNHPPHCDDGVAKFHHKRSCHWSWLHNNLLLHGMSSWGTSKVWVFSWISTFKAKKTLMTEPSKRWIENKQTSVEVFVKYFG